MTSIHLKAVKLSTEYRLVKQFYGTSKAERSQVPKINHIDEGLAIMDELGASQAAMQAYCLHPLFQNDAELCTDGYAAVVIPGVSPVAIMLVMEYRQRANAWLSDKVKLSNGLPVFNGAPDYGVLAEVKHMLIADKVQNYKDFLAHHSETHERRHELEAYFTFWLRHLGVRKLQFRALANVAERATAA